MNHCSSIDRCYLECFEVCSRRILTIVLNVRLSSTRVAVTVLVIYSVSLLKNLKFINSLANIPQAALVKCVVSGDVYNCYLEGCEIRNFYVLKTRV